MLQKRQDTHAAGLGSRWLVVSIVVGYMIDAGAIGLCRAIDRVCLAVGLLLAVLLLLVLARCSGPRSAFSVARRAEMASASGLGPSNVPSECLRVRGAGGRCRWRSYLISLHRRACWRRTLFSTSSPEGVQLQVRRLAVWKSTFPPPGIHERARAEKPRHAWTTLARRRPLVNPELHSPTSFTCTRPRNGLPLPPASP